CLRGGPQRRSWVRLWRRAGSRRTGRGCGRRHERIARRVGALAHAVVLPTILAPIDRALHAVERTPLLELEHTLGMLRVGEGTDAQQDDRERLRRLAHVVPGLHVV